MNRRQLYEGALLFQSPSPASRALVKLYQGALQDFFGDCPREPAAQFFDALTRLRQQFHPPEAPRLCRQILRESGFEPDEFALDSLRIRGVAPGSHLVPAARAAFYSHRDTWYANPQAQFNLWIPLHAVDSSNSFAFYPDWFAQPIANNSEQFNYDTFRQQAGFQTPGASQTQVFPRALTQPDQGALPVELEEAGRLWFSAAHLHQTLPNLSPQNRFSLDLRAVHRGDHELGRGAPNCDNRSQGCTLEDYRW